MYCYMWTCCYFIFWYQLDTQKIDKLALIYTWRLRNYYPIATWNFPQCHFSAFSRCLLLTYFTPLEFHLNALTIRSHFRSSSKFVK